MTTAIDYRATRLAEAQAAAEARAAELPAFVAHARTIRADFDLNVSTGTELAMVLGAIGGHNDFDPAAAAVVLGDLVPEMMDVTIKSCTDGPYLYFQLPHYDGHRLAHLRTGSMGDKLADEHLLTLAQRLVDAGKTLKADMIRVSQSSQPNGADVVHGRTGDTPHTVTLWWD